MRALAILILACGCSTQLAPIPCASNDNCAPGSQCGADGRCSTCPPAGCAPLAPGAVTAKGGERQVALSWPRVPDATSYVVRVAPSSHGSYTDLATVTDERFTHRSLSPATRYFYVVHAIGAGGPGPDSSEAAALTVPDAPGNVRATGGGGVISIGWDAAPGAQSYRIVHPGAAEPVRVGTSITLSYDDQGLADGVTLSYAVQSLNESGPSAPSVTVTASTAPPPATPSISAPSLITAGTSAVATVAARDGMTYQWTLTGGTPASGAGPTLNFTAGASGEVKLSCVETNAANHASSPGLATAAIVDAPATPAITTAGVVTTGDKQIAASVADRSAAGMKYAWTSSGGGALNRATGASVDWNAGAVGSATLSCTETNAAGVSSQAGTVAVTIADAPVAPIINTVAQARTGATNLGAAINPRPGMTYAWSIAGGTIAGSTSGASVTWSAGPPGTLTLTCVETNAAGRSAQGTVAVTVTQATAAWTQLAPTGTAPSPRYSHKAFYDPATKRAIIVTGADTTYSSPAMRNDVWALNAGDGSTTPSWTQLALSGTQPAGRGYAAIGYDSAKNTLILSGGNGSISYCYGTFSDLWLLSYANGRGGAPAWTQLTPPAPVPSKRGSHSGVYDAAHQRFIIYGGGDACGPGLNDTWVLSGQFNGTPVWTQLAPAGPLPAPDYANAVYDAASNRLILWNVLKSEAWVLTNANGLGGTPVWTKLAPSGSFPPTLYGAATVYLADRNELIVIEDGTRQSTPTNVMVWALTNANGLGSGTPAWEQRPITGSGPLGNNDFASWLVPGTSPRIGTFAGLAQNGTAQQPVLNGDTWMLAIP